MQRSRRFRVVASAAVLAAMLAIPASGSAANPAGNNGTVKVDGLDFDQHPNNEPHVGCTFEIDFYGYDEDVPGEDQLNAHVIFELQPPTGTGLLLKDDVWIGEDSNAGGGSEAGLDAEREYTLTIPAGIEPHPNQGYHIKLTVNAEGSRGADTKHKTFWVTDCECTEPGGGGGPPPDTNG